MALAVDLSYKPFVGLGNFFILVVCGFYFLYHVWVSDFSKCLLCFYWYSRGSTTHPTIMMNYVDWLVVCLSNFVLWGQMPLLIVSNYFYLRGLQKVHGKCVLWKNYVCTSIFFHHNEFIFLIKNCKNFFKHSWMMLLLFASISLQMQAAILIKNIGL